MGRSRRVLWLVGAAVVIAPGLACGFGGEESEPVPAQPTPAPEATRATADEREAASPNPGDSEASDLIGTRHVAHFESSGFAYPAVVTGAYGDGTLRVVYADGDSERVSRDALYPEQIAVGAQVQARIRSWPRFYPGRIANRVTHAVFVEFDDGDRQWTSVGLVRMPVSALSRTAPAGSDSEPTGTFPEVGTAVLANYRAQGWFYPAVIQAAEGDGLHVIYADGDSETLPSSSVRPDDLGPGVRVQAVTRVLRANADRSRPGAGGEPRPGGVEAPTEGIITRRVGHAVELGLEDGSKVWAALLNVRVR